MEWVKFTNAPLVALLHAAALAAPAVVGGALDLPPDLSGLPPAVLAKQLLKPLVPRVPKKNPNLSLDLLLIVEFA